MTLITVAVGAPGHNRVYVFRRTETSWVEEAELTELSNTPRDKFGTSIALFDETLAVGTAGDDGSFTGSPLPCRVYLYKRRANIWAQEAMIELPTNATSIGDPCQIDLAQDTLVVGAPGEGSGSPGISDAPGPGVLRNSGAVFAYTRDATGWTQQALIKASNPDEGDLFGASIALWKDTLVVGAPHEDSDGLYNDEINNDASASGAVYVFRRTAGKWKQEAYLKASNTGANDRFGHSVTVSGDSLAVMAPFEDGTSTGVNGPQNDETGIFGRHNRGAVYVFRRNARAWTQEAYIKSASTTSFGFRDAVELFQDLLVVTAADTDRRGAIFTYRRLQGIWAEEAEFEASNGGIGDRFGSSVAASNDTLVVGAEEEDSDAVGVDGHQFSNHAPNAGAAFVFE